MGGEDGCAGRMQAIIRTNCGIVHLVGCRGETPGGGGTWVFFGWECAARDSKLGPRSKKNFP